MSRHLCQLLWLIGLAVCSVAAVFAQPTPGAVPDDWATTRTRELVRTNDGTIAFFGRVTDQNGLPVGGAEVNLSIRHFSPIPPDFMETYDLAKTTGQDGRFEVTDRTGELVFAEDIRKEGYELDWGANPSRGYWYRAPLVGDPPLPTQERPAQFVLRKMGDGAVLLKSYHPAHSFKSPGGTTRMDFVKALYAVPAERPADIAVTAVYRSEERRWDISLVPLGEGAGILATTSTTYVAPTGGYATSTTLTVALTPHAPTVVKCGDLYIRSRTPSIWTRISGVELEVSDVRALLVAKAAWTNPFGERNLEPAVGIDAKTYADIAEAARKALTKGILPTSPDMATLPRVPTGQ